MYKPFFTYSNSQIRPLFCWFIILFSFSLKAESNNGQLVLTFYSEQFVIPFDKALQAIPSPAVNEKKLVSFFKTLQKSNYRILLKDLQQKKERLQLNDWFFYDLIKQSIDQILLGQPVSKRELCCWFFLSKAGFDTRLAYLSNEVYLYAYTKDEIFEVPMIEENGKTYVNLSSAHSKKSRKDALYLLNFIAQPNGKAFSFYLNKLPKLQKQVVSKEFEFLYKSKWHKINVEVDKTIIDIMDNYPYIAEEQYLETPLSSSISGSLIPQLKAITHNKSTKEVLELLVTFTRSSFRYKDDNDFFGYSKPMIADEVFHYQYSDCEDRAALLYALVKELLNLPMIIVAFADHLTLGIAWENSIGAHIEYKGRNYFICDPTGPVNSSDICEFPAGYEEKSFEIIGSYR